MSPLNLGPLTSRSQQVSLQELAFINEHLLHNSRPTHHHGVNSKLSKQPYNSHRTPRSGSGWSTPLLNTQGSGAATPSAIDEEEGDYFGSSLPSTAHDHPTSSSSVPFSPVSFPNSPFRTSFPSYSYEYSEEDDIRAEIRADAERPFPVDRTVLKELIRAKMGTEVERVVFLSSGEFLLVSFSFRYFWTPCFLFFRYIRSCVTGLAFGPVAIWTVMHAIHMHAMRERVVDDSRRALWLSIYHIIPSSCLVPLSIDFIRY